MACEQCAGPAAIPAEPCGCGPTGDRAASGIDDRYLAAQAVLTAAAVALDAADLCEPCSRYLTVGTVDTHDLHFAGNDGCECDALIGVIDGLVAPIGLPGGADCEAYTWPINLHLMLYRPAPTTPAGKSIPQPGDPAGVDRCSLNGAALQTLRDLTALTRLGAYLCPASDGGRTPTVGVKMAGTRPRAACQVAFVTVEVTP